MILRSLPIAVVLVLVPLDAGAQPAAGEDVGALAPEPAERGVRVRYGVSLGAMAGGGSVAPNAARRDGSDDISPAFGAELLARFGVQLHDRFAIYYQGALGGGDEVPMCFGGTRCDDTGDYLLVHASSIVLEGTIGAGFQIGAGATAAGALLATHDVIAQASFGYLVRVGYAFGGSGPGARAGFAMAFQAGMSLPVAPIEDGVLAQFSLALGWESF